MISTILDQLTRKLLFMQVISGTVISGRGKNIVVGKHVSFGGNVFLFGTAQIEIGDYSMIAYGTIIHTSTHDYHDHPMWSKRIDRPVKIGKHVWIGTGSIILPGVIIEDFAVVGAGSVVTSNVKSGTIVAGNPARVIRKRNKREYNQKLTITAANQAEIVQDGYLKKYCR